MATKCKTRFFLLIQKKCCRFVVILAIVCFSSVIKDLAKSLCSYAHLFVFNYLKLTDAAANMWCFCVPSHHLIQMRKCPVQSSFDKVAKGCLYPIRSNARRITEWMPHTAIPDLLSRSNAYSNRTTTSVSSWLCTTSMNFIRQSSGWLICGHTN